MPYSVYKLIHFLGIFLMLSAVTVAAARALSGYSADRSARRMTAIVHGVAVFLILLGGFGMLARLGIVHDGLPGWIHAKLGIWVLAGLAILLPGRSPRLARAALIGLPLLAVVAGAVALYKPFG